MVYIKLLTIAIYAEKLETPVCVMNGSVAEVNANRSEIQICATESSSSTKWMITSIWKSLSPSLLKGSDLSE